MKLFKTSGFKYLFYLEVVLIFSIVVSLLVFLVWNRTAEKKTIKTVDPSVISVDNKTRDNFVRLQQLLSVNITPIDDVSLVQSDFLVQLKLLETIEDKLKKNRNSDIQSQLNEVVEDFEFIKNQKNKLFFKSLYYNKKYDDFIRKFDRFPISNDELVLLYINSQVKVKNLVKAQTVFNNFFINKKLAKVKSMMSLKDINRFIKGFSEEYWIKKLFNLVDTNQYTEFRKIRSFIEVDELKRVILAFFRYRQNDSRRTRENLKNVKSEKYLPFKYALLAKMKIKKDLDAEINYEVEQVSKNILINKRFLLNIGKIYFLNNKIKKSIFYFNKLLKLYRGKKLPKDSGYQDLLWMNMGNYFRGGGYKTSPEFFAMLEEGCNVDKISIHTACRYWYNKLRKKEYPLATHPYNYYSLISNQNKNKLYFKGVNSFLAKIQNIDNIGKITQIEQEVKKLLENDLIKEAIDLLKGEIWYSKKLNVSEKRFLRLVISVIYLRKEKYQRAFSEFIRGIDDLQAVIPPSFLKEIYYPLKYKREIDHYSSLYNLKPGIIYSLIRGESFFNNEAYSYAKASGLMQLLVGTANEMRTNSKRLRRKDLFQPLLNIKLGTKYLRFLMDKYDNKLYLALAAYNAGPHRVDKWLKFYSGLNREEFIESIPFSATRGYVKKILRDSILYKLYYNDSIGGGK